MQEASPHGREQPVERLAAGILVTAYPDDDVRARALNDGVVCYLRKPLMRSVSCGVFVRLSILVSRAKRIHELLSALGKVN